MVVPIIRLSRLLLGGAPGPRQGRIHAPGIDRHGDPRGRTLGSLSLLVPGRCGGGGGARWGLRILCGPVEALGPAEVGEAPTLPRLVPPCLCRSLAALGLCDLCRLRGRSPCLDGLCEGRGVADPIDLPPELELQSTVSIRHQQLLEYAGCFCCFGRLHRGLFFSNRRQRPDTASKAERRQRELGPELGREGRGQGRRWRRHVVVGSFHLQRAQ
mmetsp:Transcript_143091/g.457230  ORF Transcript_143091/g.457230 Transcript_143091/m.457230 type:complete len:214 (+) Transcript_143091:222-863(+)